MSDPQRPHGLQPIRLLRPWVFQTGVLEWGATAFSELALALLIVVVVSLTECLTPFFPMDCSPPGSPTPGKRTGVLYLVSISTAFEAINLLFFLLPSELWKMPCMEVSFLK